MTPAERQLLKGIVFVIAAIIIAACDFNFNVTGPQGNVLGWCYSDSLKAARDSFPLCPPDSLSLEDSR